jgi:hypothetical protein
MSLEVEGWVLNLRIMKIIEIEKNLIPGYLETLKMASYFANISD